VTSIISIRRRLPSRVSSYQSGDSLKNPSHWKFGTNEFYFKTPAEMALDFPGHEDAMRRSLEVAERCNVEIELGRIHLPQFPVPDGREAFDYLVELCEKGLVRRYGASTPELEERLRFELKTIREMGFADYFLIVADFIGFAKLTASRSGPGRGRPPARSRRTASGSPTSTRCATGSSSSGSSTLRARTCRTWTSTSRSRVASA
jgi:DNA polymerase-3 subunit alpha